MLSRAEARPAGAHPAAITIGRAEPVQPRMRLAEGRGVRVTIKEDLVLLVAVAAAAIGVAAYAAVSLNLFLPRESDAMQRAYYATQVLFGFEPRLSNMGLTLTPLPTLAQLPVILLAPGVAFAGFSSAVVSAVAAGVAVVALNRALSLYVPQRHWRYAMLAAYQFNPIIAFLTVSGSDAMLAIAFLVTAWLAFQRVFFEEPLPIVQVAVLGSALAGAFLTRYELVIAGAMYLGLLVALSYFQKRPGQWPFTEGVTVAALTPFGYVVIAWIFFNELIASDPFYFINGAGALLDQAKARLFGAPLLQDLVGSPSNAFEYVRLALDTVAPSAQGIAAIAAVLTVLKRDLFLMALLLITLTFPVMEMVLLVEGLSSGLPRTVAVALPFVVILAGYVTRPQYLPYPGWFPRSLVRIIAVFLLLFSSAAALPRIAEPAVAREGETGYLAALLSASQGILPPVELERAAYFRTLLQAEPEALVRIDDLGFQTTVLFSGHPGRFVTPNSANFAPYVNNPSSRVRFFVVPENAVLSSDTILGGYLRLFRDGSPLVTLERTFPAGPGEAAGWQLFRINPGAG